MVEADKHEIQAQLIESKERLLQLSNHLKHKDQMIKTLDEVRLYYNEVLGRK